MKPLIIGTSENEAAASQSLFYWDATLLIVQSRSEISVWKMASAQSF